MLQRPEIAVDRIGHGAAGRHGLPFLHRYVGAGRIARAGDIRRPGEAARERQGEKRGKDETHRSVFPSAVLAGRIVRPAHVRHNEQA